eukprot:15325090-Ditylum_brightwellii.AAC.1
MCLDELHKRCSYSSFNNCPVDGMRSEFLVTRTTPEHLKSRVSGSTTVEIAGPNCNEVIPAINNVVIHLDDIPEKREQV